jgi:uncharacterized protein
VELEGGPRRADGGSGMKRAPTKARPAAERAMGDAELERWLRARRAHNPLVKTLPMLDGFVTAMAAGPIGLDLMGHICAALALKRSAWDVGATPEFAAIKATADRFNALSATLSDAEPKPLHARKSNGDIDAAPWCEGFLTAVNLDRKAWQDVLNLDNHLHGLTLPILLHCKNNRGEPMLGPPRAGIETQIFLKQAYTDIPMSVRAIRDHYHVTRYNEPPHRAPYR